MRGSKAPENQLILDLEFKRDLNSDLRSEVCGLGSWGAGPERLARIKDILEAGADANSLEGNIQAAVVCGNPEVLRLFLEHGMDLSVRYDPSQSTPLHLTGWGPDAVECAKLLLAHGADPLAEDADGRRVHDLCSCDLQRAREQGWGKIFLILNELRQVLAEAARQKTLQKLKPSKVRPS